MKRQTGKHEPERYFRQPITKMIKSDYGAQLFRLRSRFYACQVKTSQNLFRLSNSLSAN